MNLKIMGILIATIFMIGKAHSQVPWINVPMVNGPAGPYACITRPTYDQRIAIITCDSNVVGRFPPFVQSFLNAHEHGHVYQIVYNPQILMTGFAEYDADCYAATYMVFNDPQSLAWSIQWFRQVLGPYGGDAVHGNGFQMAQRATECAHNANPAFNADLELPRPGSKQPVMANSFFGEASSPKPPTSYPRPKGMTKTGTLKAVVTQNDVEPTACTALEFLIESSHTSFWEASDETGSITPNVSKAFNASCHVGGVLRRQIECTQQPRVAPNLRTETVRCLAAKEWEKHCDDANCLVETLRHPGDSEDHVEVSVTTASDGVETMKLVAPEQVAHDHDSKSYDGIANLMKK
jgi:hypothetical protein